MRPGLTERWYREGSGWMLQPLALVYGAAVRLRRAAYERGALARLSAGKPVIVVGNLTVGGTGKTPLVAWLAQELSRTGLRVGIVSRGYGRADAHPSVVQGESDWRAVGDEPLLLRRLTGCDTIVARDRVAGARQLVARGADIVIADDGLQHLRLERDCEIVVIDGARGFGNLRLLPAGPLREPPQLAHSAGIIVINGAPEHPTLAQLSHSEPGPLHMNLFGTEAHRLDGLAAAQTLETFRTTRVHAVAGIGNPGRFFRGLRERGIEICAHAFPDHHPFTAADLSFGDELPVLMTEKDAVRCRELANPRLWYVPVVARFPEAESRELLGRVMRTLDPAWVAKVKH